MRIIGVICFAVLLAGCTPTNCEGLISPSQCPACNCPPTTETTTDEDPLIIYFIDVGQGDAILLKYLEQEMLIDCGKNSKGYEVVDYLQDHGVIDLEYLLITHPDSDHLGGCDDVLRSIQTRVMITNGEIKDTHSYNEVKEEANKQKAEFGMQILEAREGDTWYLGPVEIKIIQADNGFEDTNQNSIVTMVTHEQVKALLTGDCDKDCEDLLIDKEIKADILKVAHHGTKFGTTIPFLNKVNPNTAIISVGNNNYGHPTEETLDRLDQERVGVFRTDIEGHIQLVSDGVRYEVK